MRYIDMVRKAPEKSEKTMWESLERVSQLVDKLLEAHDALARKFMMGEYAAMYGSHFNEELARATVAEMWHHCNGKKVEGELVCYDEAKQYAPSEDECWDAYVGLNGMLHDLAKTELSDRDVMAIARAYWFEDDDFDEESKVWWYYSHK